MKVFFSVVWWNGTMMPTAIARPMARATSGEVPRTAGALVGATGIGLASSGARANETGGTGLVGYHRHEEGAECAESAWEAGRTSKLPFPIPAIFVSFSRRNAPAALLRSVGQTRLLS